MLIVTELRLLWTLSTRQAVNQFSADVMKAMRAYYDSSSEGERKGQGSDDEDEEDEEAPPAQQQQQDEGPGGVGVSMGAGDDDDLGMSIDLDRRRSFDSALSLSAGPSSLNSPPLSPCVALESPGAEGAGMSDLARRFLLTRSSQQGNSSNTNGSMSGTPLLPPPLGGKRRSSHVTLEMGGGRAQTGSGGSRRSSKGACCTIDGPLARSCMFVLEDTHEVLIDMSRGWLVVGWIRVCSQGLAVLASASSRSPSPSSSSTRRYVVEHSPLTRPNPSGLTEARLLLLVVVVVMRAAELPQRQLVRQPDHRGQ